MQPSLFKLIKIPSPPARDFEKLLVFPNYQKIKILLSLSKVTIRYYVKEFYSPYQKHKRAKPWKLLTKLLYSLFPHQRSCFSYIPRNASRD
jgi:hypothetical protein